MIFLNIFLFHFILNYTLTKMSNSSQNSIQTFKYKHTWQAAERGDLEELKKMHENGCEWNSETTRLAALYGQLECLKYFGSISLQNNYLFFMINTYILFYIYN